MSQKRNTYFQHFIIFTEPYNMYFYDVRESYFDAYRDVMNPFYKDPNGRICTYTEMKRHSVYYEPFYLNEDKHHVGEEGRKYMMPSDRLWTKALRPSPV